MLGTLKRVRTEKIGRVEANLPRARLGAAVLLLWVASCATQPVPAPADLTCAPPCAAIREVKFPATIIVTLHAPPGSHLKNAMLTSAASRACGSGVPVKQVDVDGQRYLEGPAALGGTHTLDLLFPFVAQDNAPDAGLSRPVSLDIDLRTPAGHTCVRLRVGQDAPNSWTHAGEPSYRMEPRP